MANPKTPGDLFVQTYCDLNGYFWTYEPDLGSPGPLDYLIDRAGDRAVVEVKHFTTTRQIQRLMAAPGQAMFMGVYGGEGAAVLHRDSAGTTFNRLPHLSAVVAMYGMLQFPRADVYDLAGVHGFAGTPLPRTMLDADGDTWLGFLEPDRFGRLPQV